MPNSDKKQKLILEFIASFVDELSPEADLDFELAMLLEKMFATLDGKVHPYYDRVVGKAKFYRQVVTGEHQESLIISYKERETKAQKEQRIKLTFSYTKEVSNQILAQFKKLKKADKVLDRIEYTENQEANLSLINSLLEVFHPSKTLDQYLLNYFIHYNAVDPNAWLVIPSRAAELQGREVNQAYPVVWDSKQVFLYGLPV